MGPAFHSVLDLGLRDVGVRNDPGRVAAHFGKRTPLFAALVKRAPIAVVKVRADGTNQATWLVIALFVLSALTGLLAWNLVLIPPAALTLMMMALVVWRGRRRLPKLLRSLQALIAADEAVLGDGMGLAQGSRGGRAALRVIIATDRRLLVAGSCAAIVLDVPYDQVSRFEIEWKQRGRIGVVSLTVAGEAHVITSIAPANLLSIARVLQAHGVDTDDPAAVAEAERAWDEALRRGGTPVRLLDRAAMRTREYDRGLWLLLGLCAFLFYLNPLGVGIGASRDAAPALLAVPLLSCQSTAGRTSAAAPPRSPTPPVPASGSSSPKTRR